MPRCENCGRAMANWGSATSFIPGVDICERAGCELVASRARDRWANDDPGIVGFGHDDHAIRVTQGRDLQ